MENIMITSIGATNRKPGEDLDESESGLDVLSRLMDYAAPAKKHTHDYFVEYALHTQAGGGENSLEKYEL